MTDETFHVGFTGTRNKPTDYQEKRLLELFMFLQSKGATALHHGDCVGADVLAHKLAIRAGFEVIYIHPPTDGKLRAYCDALGTPIKGGVLEAPRPYLTRNRDIVQSSAVLVAVPSRDEIVRSGTWATVRYARECGMPIYLIFPFRINAEGDPFDWHSAEPFQSPWRRS